LSELRPPSSLANVSSYELGEPAEVHGGTSCRGVPTRQPTIRMVSSRISAMRTTRGSCITAPAQERR
jgi:hypothetical protein